jgi:hypothetical protein
MRALEWCSMALRRRSIRFCLGAEASVMALVHSTDSAQNERTVSVRPW